MKRFRWFILKWMRRNFNLYTIIQLMKGAFYIGAPLTFFVINFFPQFSVHFLMLCFLFFCFSRFFNRVLIIKTRRFRWIIRTRIKNITLDAIVLTIRGPFIGAFISIFLLNFFPQYVIYFLIICFIILIFF